MRILAGTDLKVVTLPDVPQGHRWVIDRRKVRESSWGDSYWVTDLCISLEKESTNWRGKFKWAVVDSKRILPEYMGASNRMETMVECAERLAGLMRASQIKKLKRVLEQESIIGVYEQGTKQALS